MKKITLFSIFIFSVSVTAQENTQTILCTGTSNDGALLEIALNLNTNKNIITVDQQSINLSANNDFTVSWTTSVQGIRYDNFLSKITGSMVVIAIDEGNSTSGIRANLNCVKRGNRVFN